MISIFRLHIPWPLALLAIADLLALAFSAFLGISIRNSFALTTLSLRNVPLSDLFLPDQEQAVQILAYAASGLTALFMLGVYRRRFPAPNTNLKTPRRAIAKTENRRCWSIAKQPIRR